jgi:hypothetical protein
MVPLMQQIEEVNLELELIVDGDENRVAIDAYENFFEKFVPIIRKLDDSCTKRTVLKAIPKDPLEQQGQSIDNLKGDLVATIGALNILEEKWKKDDYKVTQDDSFDNSIQSIKGLTKTIMDTNKIVWKTWCDHLLDGFNITDAELSSIEKIDKYKDTYNEFVKERASFKSKASDLPTVVNQIEDLQGLSNRLQMLIKDIDFNIPAEVKIFFDYINNAINGNKAPLKLLTPEVLKWIETNNEMTSFSIIRSSRNH